MFTLNPEPPLNKDVRHCSTLDLRSSISGSYISYHYTSRLFGFMLVEISFLLDSTG